MDLAIPGSDDSDDPSTINVVVVKEGKAPIKNNGSSLHYLKKDPKTSETIALCSMCGKNFATNYNLKRHMANCRLCPDDEKIRHSCHCGRTYSQEYDMKKHMLTCLPNRHQTRNHRPCLFPFCNLMFYHRSQLIVHMKSVHAVNIPDPEELAFSSMEEFKAWKEKLEEETYTFYSKQTGSHATKISVNTYYVCQFDGSDRAHSSSPRKTDRRNKKGRVKTGRFCWSQMKVKELPDKTVRVVYYQSHTHPVTAADAEHHPLPTSFKKEIERRLEQIKDDEANGVSARTRRKGPAMTVRNLRAFARKNRKLFRITTNAISDTVDETQDVPLITLISNDQTVRNDKIMILPKVEEEEDPLIDVVPPDVRPDDELAVSLQQQTSFEAVIESCHAHWNQLSELIGTHALSDFALVKVHNTLVELLQSCRDSLEQNGQTSEELYPVDQVSPPPADPEPPPTLQLEPNKAIYQMVAPLSPGGTDIVIEPGAVELVGPRELIIFTQDPRQLFKPEPDPATFIPALNT